MTARPAFVFLREDGETNNAAVARCAHQATEPGPMGRLVRPADYRSFIDGAFVDSAAAPVFLSGGTHCAIFNRGCWVHAGVKERKGRPRVTGITSWLGVGWFQEPEWIPVDELDTVLPGDTLYWCGFPGMNVVQWRSATNGHVGIVLAGGEGWNHPTAEGGGGVDGSVCRQSPGPKYVLASHNRPLRGVWRPDNMREQHAPVA